MPVGEAYDGMGEFHDLFMDEAWMRLEPLLREAFSSLTGSATVLDLGAGTGVGTRVLGRCTAARIFAVEPSRTMRAVLTARVADDADLRGRVTVVADRIPGGLAGVRAPAAGFVCAHVLGHLTETDRRATFRRLAEMLHPTGIGVVTTSTGSTEPRPEVVEEIRHIGDLTYLARFHRPAEDGMSVTDYEVRRDTVVLRREVYRSAWRAPSHAQLRVELADAGLELEVVGDGTGVVRVAGGGRRAGL